MSRLLCGFTPTCNRPELLGRMIKCFSRQTYENRFLVILDDLGQYDNQSGDRWELVSVRRRILSLGEKNNCAVAMAPRDTFALVKMDDDDFYAPWHFEAMAEALERGDLVQPRHAIDFVDGRWVVSETYNRRFEDHFAYHGTWAFRRSLFERVGGYRPRYAGDDGELQERLLALGVRSVDVDQKYPVSYWYNRGLPGRISERGGSEQAYWESAPAEPKWVGKVPEWTSNEDWERPIPTERIARPW